MRNLFIVSFLFVQFVQAEVTSITKNRVANYHTNNMPKKMSVAEKKKRFFALLVPAINDVYKELEVQYLEVKKDIATHTNQEKIERLKRKYKVRNNQALLIALKPLPRSIALAQAAIESSWGTSRFFREANNIFGVWSTNAQQKRIAAGKKRGKQTIWLRKFDTIEDAISQYYFMVSTAPAYKMLKKISYKTDNVNYILIGLNRYSERGGHYVKELKDIIHHNKLTKYDG